MSRWLVRIVMLAAAAVFLGIALAIRAVTAGSLYSDEPLAQYSGTALYASMVYAGVVFVRPCLPSHLAGLAALAFCWLVELSQLTGVPAALSQRSLLARLALGVQFDWVDMLWYPAGILPLVVADRLLNLRPTGRGPYDRGHATAVDSPPGA